MNISTWAFRPW